MVLLLIQTLANSCYLIPTSASQRFPSITALTTATKNSGAKVSSASPITYRISPEDRQYGVIAAGGHGWSEPGDALMAFALPVPDAR